MNAEPSRLVRRLRLFDAMVIGHGATIGALVFAAIGSRSMTPCAIPGAHMDSSSCVRSGRTTEPGGAGPARDGARQLGHTGRTPGTETVTRPSTGRRQKTEMNRPGFPGGSGVLTLETRWSQGRGPAAAQLRTSSKPVRSCCEMATAAFTPRSTALRSGHRVHTDRSLHAPLPTRQPHAEPVRSGVVRPRGWAHPDSVFLGHG